MSIVPIILVVIGFILLFIEIFLLPGSGPVGVLGVVLMVLGVVIAGYKEGLRMAVIYAGISAGGALPLCAVGLWLIPRTKLGKSFILDASEHSQAGFKSSSEELEKFAGKTGVTLTPLRPAGIAEMDGVRVNVLTQGEFVESGKEVEVIKIEGSKVIVKEL